MSSIPDRLNYDSDFPAPPSGKFNVVWQVNTGIDGIAHLSAYVTALAASASQNYIPKFTSAGMLQNSRLEDDGTHVTLHSGNFYIEEDTKGLFFGNSGAASESIRAILGNRLDVYINGSITTKLNKDGSLYILTDAQGILFGDVGSATEALIAVHGSEIQAYVNNNLTLKLNTLDSASQTAMSVRHDGSLKVVKTFDDGMGHAVLYVDL